MKLSAILATGLIFASGSAAWVLKLFSAKDPDEHLTMYGIEKKPDCITINETNVRNLGEVGTVDWQPRIDMAFWVEPPVGVMLYEGEDCTGQEFPIWDDTNKKPNKVYLDPARVFESYSLEYEKGNKREASEEEEVV